MIKYVSYRRLNNKCNYYQVCNITFENDNTQADIVKQIDVTPEIEEKLLYQIFQLKNGKMEKIFDLSKYHFLQKQFYSKYQDFVIQTSNNISSDLAAKISESVWFQEKAIKHLINAITSNFDIMDSGISKEEKEKLVSDILIYGPKGNGKEKIIRTLLAKANIASIVVNLDDSIDDILKNVFETFINDDNFKRNQKGIVFIEKNDNENSEEDVEYANNNSDDENSYSYFDVILKLKSIIKQDLNISLKDKPKEKINLNLENLIFIVCQNTPYDLKDEGIFYEGISEKFFANFKNRIYVPRLEKGQMKTIIIHNNDSIINSYHRVCDKIGKKLKVPEDFIDTLINKYYDYDGGLILLYDIIEKLIKLKWHYDIIELTKYDLKNEENIIAEDINEQKKEQISDLRQRFLEYYLHIKEYVKGQDKPLQEILYQVFLNDIYQESDLSPEEKKANIKHILIRGKTGTGKTFISSLIAKSFNKPYIIADAKQYTEAGYVGKSVDDMLIQLYNISGQNLTEAENGILIIDEFDKLATQASSEVDVNHTGVQESLLKIFEGTTYDLEIKNGLNEKHIPFNTQSLTIICLGAFEGLDKIREQRLKKAKSGQAIGFCTEDHYKYIDCNYSIEDMDKFGINSQILRRISCHKDLNELDKNCLKEIMLESKASAFLNKIKQLAHLHIEVVYNDEFVDAFIEKASRMGYGASSIDILVNNIFQEFEIKAFLEGYSHVILTKECVEDPSKVKLLNKNTKMLKKTIF